MRNAQGKVSQLLGAARLGLVLAALLACKEDREPPPSHYPTCETSRISQVPLDEETAAGSASAALADHLGERSCTWTWNDNAPDVRTAASPGETTATLGLGFASSEASFHEVRVDDPDPARDISCDPYILVDLNLTLSTQDGQVNGEIPVAASIRGGKLPSIASEDFALEDVGVEAIWNAPWDPGTEALSLWINGDGSLEGGLLASAGRPDRNWGIAVLAEFHCSAAQ
ncbi:MAG: hypothetical protein KC766_29220 [Myxococcales bacterium]|nr:hypothetical protein [Myxococcales bacterium]